MDRADDLRPEWIAGITEQTVFSVPRGLAPRTD